MSDANGSITTYLAEAVSPAPNPGDAVSFTATAVENYAGKLEITSLTGWTVDSSNNSVLVRNGHGVALDDYASQGNFTYETYGEITSAIGECGPETTCWNFTHGGATTELRIKDDVGVMEGDCLHVIAPVYYFQDNALYDITNWDWKEFY